MVTEVLVCARAVAVKTARLEIVNFMVVDTTRVYEERLIDAVVLVDLKKEAVE